MKFQNLTNMSNFTSSPILFANKKEVLAHFLLTNIHKESFNTLE
jgi:hypothetical protein